MDNPPPWRWWKDLQFIVDPDITGDAFRGYRDTLAIAITPDDIPQLVNSLYSKNIISHDNLERAMMIGILPSDKKVHLLDAIEARIRSRTSAFVTFLDILYSEPVFSEHAKRIWEKYWEQVCLSVKCVCRPDLLRCRSTGRCRCMWTKAHT